MHVSRQRVFARHVGPGKDSGTSPSFMLDNFSLSWLSMFCSHVVLGIPRGLVTVMENRRRFFSQDVSQPSKLAFCYDF